jgi:hypothetical protein
MGPTRVRRSLPRTAGATVEVGPRPTYVAAGHEPETDAIGEPIVRCGRRAGFSKATTEMLIERVARLMVLPWRGKESPESA